MGIAGSFSFFFFYCEYAGKKGFFPQNDVCTFILGNRIFCGRYKSIKYVFYGNSTLLNIRDLFFFTDFREKLRLNSRAFGCIDLDNQFCRNRF